MTTITSIRHALDCRCHACRGQYHPKIAAAVVLTLALACWALVGAVVCSLL